MHILRRLLLTLSVISGVGFAWAAAAADATIAGTVTHASNGSTVDTLLIYVENSATGDLDYAYTAANGTYTATITDDGSGTAGDYTIYNYTSTSTEPNVVFIRSVQSVTLTDGQNKTGVNFSLTRRAQLQGYVYESDGTTPVYSAYVYLTRASSFYDGYGADYSSYSGFYSVGPAPYPVPTTSAVGLYTAAVTAYGYFGTRVTGIDLAADETTYTQNFTLTPGSTVSGTVTNTDGTALAGVTVLLDDVDSYYFYTANTDSTGAFTIQVFDQYDYAGTAVGNYILTASVDNYVDRSTTVSITADDSHLTGYNLKMRRAGSLTGTVVDDASAAIDNATLTATDGYGKTYTTTSAADGSFSFTNLRASTNYTITASKTGYISRSVYNVSVAVDETTTLDDAMSLTQGVSLTGSVLTTAGDAISGATVKLFNRSKPRSSTADYSGTTISDGTFSIAGIAPGRYRVEVSDTNYATLTTNLLDLTVSLANRTFRLKVAAVVTGRVTSQGEPLYQALVVVYSKNPSTTGYGYDYTDIDGYYSIGTLEPGRYTIKISGTGFAEKILRHKLAGGQTTTLNLHVGPAGSIAGYITAADTGLPLSSYLVRVRHQTVSAYTDSNGYYIIDGLAPGRYKLYVVSVAYDTGRTNLVRVRSNKVTPSINFALQPK